MTAELTPEAPPAAPTPQGRLAGARSRVQRSWAGDFGRRLGAVEFGNTIILLGATLLLSVLPLVILLSTFANHRIDVDLSQRLSLSRKGSQVVSSLFKTSTSTSLAAVIIALLMSFAGTISVAGSLQVVYEKCFDQPHRGMRLDLWRFLVWVAVLGGLLIAKAHVSEPIEHLSGGDYDMGVLTFIDVSIFFLWSMHFFLAGRVPWRRLVPAAIFTGLFWVGLDVFSSLYLAPSIVSDSQLYGTIGVVFDLVTWFIAIAAVVILGAVAGRVWVDRRSHHPRSSPPESASPAPP